MHVLSLLVAVSCLAAAGCSETRQSTSSSSTPPTTSADNANDQRASPLEAVEAPVAAPSDGPSPWGNSVPDDDINEEACGNTAEPVGPTCSANSDCGICHDGSACGRAANREEIERAGNDCRIPDSAECEDAVVRCCAGHCRVTAN